MCKRKGIGNSHAHHINYGCIPDCIVMQNAGIEPEVLRGWFFRKILFPLLKPIKSIFTKEYRQLEKFIALMDCRQIETITERHIQEMDTPVPDPLVPGGVTTDYAIILALDFTQQLPFGENFILSYEQQIEMTAYSCVRFPFRFFLFHCFDPRKPNARELLDLAYHELGVVGIKMYPALGFHPCPDKNAHLPCGGAIQENLEYMYQFASEKDLPITSHCGPGGSYTCAVDKSIKWKTVWSFTDPSNYLDLCQRYGLRINLAHMGGKTDKRGEKKIARRWADVILNLITTAHQWNSRGRFYTDQSFDLSHVFFNEKKTGSHVRETMDYLHHEIFGQYLMYGSDWPLGYHSFCEHQYFNRYWSRMEEKPQQRLRYFSDNIAEFLFGPSRQIPDNYIAFLIKYLNRDNPIPEIQPQTPEWVEERDGKYYLL